MAYTYDDFLTKLNQSGLQGQFSQADMDTALLYPEFGMSMISAKQNYANAQTQEGRDMANALAEQLRSSYGNYVGGGDGSAYLNMGRKPSDYRSKYGSAIDDAIADLNNYDDFSYGPAPVYQSRYDEKMQGLLNDVLNRQPHLYNLETDPVWQNYKKQYTREGQRATADTLAQVATMTGGMPSSYAVNAAQQAGDYYMSQMTDMIPQLYQQSYERYLNEYNMKQNDLAAVQSMEQMDYGKYQDQLQQYNTDRDLAYNLWQDEYNMLANNIGVMQGQDATEYDRFLTDLDWNAQQQAIYREQQAQAAQNAAAQVDAMIAAGGRPSAGLIAQSGYNQEYVDAMAAYYAQQAALAAAKGSGGGGGSLTASQKEARALVDAILKMGKTPEPELLEAANYPPSYIDGMLATYGTSGGPLTYQDLLDAGIEDPKRAKEWAKLLGIDATESTEDDEEPKPVLGMNANLPLSTLMTQAGNMMATGNNIGAAEYLILAYEGGALTEAQLERTLNQLGLKDVLVFE